MTFSLVIDPGHGGDNTGCTGNGLVEKVETLRLARRLRDVARTLGCAVRMTRDDDVAVSLDARAAGPASDLVLCLHFDWSPLPAIGYIRAYTLEGRDDGSDDVARVVMQAAPDWCRWPALQVVHCRPGNWTHRAYNVLHHHQSPAVLVEACYLSNPRHAATLSTDAGAAGLVLALQAGVEKMRMRKEAACTTS